MWHSRKVKTKVDPKLSRHRKNAILSLSETDIFDKIFMASRMVKLAANSLQTSRLVSEVGASVYFEFKLRKIDFSRFPTLFLIQYSTSMHERWIQLQWVVNWWSTAKSSYFGHSNFYQQLRGHISSNWNALLSQKTGSAMVVALTLFLWDCTPNILAVKLDFFCLREIIPFILDRRTFLAGFDLCCGVTDGGERGESTPWQV